MSHLIDLALETIEQSLIIRLGFTENIKSVRIKAGSYSIRLTKESANFLTKHSKHLIAKLTPVQFVHRMELLNIDDNGIHLWLGASLMDAVCVLKKEVLIIKLGEAVQLNCGNERPFLICPALCAYRPKQQQDNDDRHPSYDSKDEIHIIPKELPNSDAIIEKRIICQCRVNTCVWHELAGFIQDGIETVILASHSKGQAHRFACGKGGEVVLYRQLT